MAERWLEERRKDYFYKKAKREGYRSRAAYKLQQINERYNVINRDNVVIDLGAAPGGWSQVAKELVGDKGFVLGLDLEEIEPLKGVEFIRGDITKKDIIENIISILKSADVVISDMSPDISGNYSIDHANSIYLCEKGLEFAERILKSNGNFITKIFQGDMFDNYLNDLRKRFKQVRIYAPEARRKRSSEIYIIAKGFKGRA